MRCPDCGLVVDETYYEQSSEEREKEIVEGHAEYQGSDVNPVDPHWIERLKIQRDVLVQLFAQNIFFKTANVVDYGCGDGKLSDYFAEECVGKSISEDTSIPIIGKYDKFMHFGADYLTDSDMSPGSFDAVITCSVFEHVLGGQDVEEIMGLLNDQGTFCLHTLVCEEVPKDPDWYYLLPGHCTIWTNKAMQILYHNYGFKGCAYHVEARMWFFFRDMEMFAKLKGIHGRITGTWVFSNEFVDYWKQKPYR